MDENEVNKMLWLAYSLGKQIVHHAHELHIPASVGLKEDELLEEIADGRTALTSTSAEHNLRFPNMREDIRESMPRRINKMISVERELAQRIIDYRNRTF